METRAQLNAKFSVRGLDFDNVSLGMVTLMDPTTMVVSLRKQRYGAPTFDIWDALGGPIIGKDTQ
jgi:hypothetical protein